MKKPLLELSKDALGAVLLGISTNNKGDKGEYLRT